jgi:Amt family ammonium transporter
MGGSIGVDSQVGVGSKFWCELPLQVSGETIESPETRRQLAGARVLIVEDAVSRRPQIAECLSVWGCSFRRATSSAKARQAVADATNSNQWFDIVLLDLQTVSEDCDALIEELSRQHGLPIVAIDTGERVNDARWVHRPAVQRRLHDPIPPSALGDAIVFALSTSSTRRKPNDSQLGLSAVRPQLTGHVLVAEDNRINQMYVTELLKHCGCTCDVVTNGDEVLEALRRGRYDLVLMDCQMPEMDGFTAAREIRRRVGTQELSQAIPIIALTANALKGDRERCLEAGMDDYLTKPVQAHQLRTKLEQFLTSSKA